MSLRRYKLFAQIILTLMLALLFGGVALAQSDAIISKFKPAEWGQKLTVVQSKAAAPDFSTEDAMKSIYTVTAMREKATQCIKAVDVEIDKINLVLGASVTTKPDAAHTASESSTTSNGMLQNGKPANSTAAGLETDKNTLIELRSQCHLFVMSADESLSKLEAIHQELVTEEIFSKNPPIWHSFNNLPSFSAFVKEIDTRDLKEKLIKPITSGDNLYIFILAVVVGVIAGFIFKFMLNKVAKRNIKNTHIFNITTTAAHHAVLLMTLLGMTLFFSALQLMDVDGIFLRNTGLALLAYLGAYLLTRILFKPPYPARAMISIPDPVPALLLRRTSILFTLLLLYFVIGGLFADQDLTTPVVKFSGNLFITFLSVSLISLGALVNRLPKLQTEHRWLKITLNAIFAGLLILVLLADWLGFHVFSLYLVKNIALSLCYFFIAWMLHVGLYKLISLLDGKEYAWQQKFRYLLGLRYDSHLYEVVILKTIVVVLVWGWFVASLMKTWVLSQAYFDKLMIGFSEGFNVFNISLNPAKIMIALVLFSLLSFVNRFVKAKVGRRSAAYVDGGQVAIASVVGYTGFAIAVVISLVVSGFNFTGLAIVAGALSVGIGFGLQHIANNFISGLVLLIEAPIKPGDRVLVGDIEGFVKHIHLRSTEITTLYRSSVFIPNSEMLQKNVINFMKHDSKWGVSCPVGVDYGSDLDKVKEVMLRVANSHPGVSKEKGDEAAVFLKSFGDSSINFSLFCIIKDVNKKIALQSELNILIAKEFAKEGIGIPFPQQDLYIKEWPEKNKE